MSRKHHTHNGLLWYSASTPPPSNTLRAILVAVDMDGHRHVERGFINRYGAVRAVGISTPPYAWAWMPPSPPQHKAKPFAIAAGIEVES